MLVEVEPGVHLFVEAEGHWPAEQGDDTDTRPAMLLLHGAEVDHSWFRPAFDELRDVLQPVYVDHRGFGRSDHRPISEYGLHTWAEDVHRLCQRLGIKRPIVLGSSLGGVIALAYATLHPTEPCALIVASAAAHDDAEARFAVWGRIGGQQAERAAREFFESPEDLERREEFRHLCMPLLHRFTWTKEQLERIVPPDPHMPRAALRGYNFLPELSRIRCPALLIAGAEDPAAPVASMELTRDAFRPGLAQLRVFDRAGHGVCRDAPQEFFETVREFIAARV